jgi:citrate synthase
MEKLVREIQEGMPVPRRVRLMCEGTVFESWEPLHGVGLDPDQWARDAETLVQALIPELPKRRVQLSFVAEDSSGATLGTLLRTVTGQNANAQDLGTQNGAKALADAIASVAKTTDFVGEMARKMLEYQSAQIEKLNNQLTEAHELFMAIKKAELDSTEQESAASRIMVEQVQQAAPLLMQLIEHWVKNPKPNGGVVASVAAAATNGAH